VNNRLLYIGLGSVFVVMIGLYFIQFGFYPLSDSPQNWGAFGDFLGGILNPIISFTALIILVKTIKQNEKALHQAQTALQQNENALKHNAEELELSRNELSRSAKSQEEQAELQRKRFIQEYTENQKTRLSQSIQFKVGLINSSSNKIRFREKTSSKYEYFNSLKPDEVNRFTYSFDDEYHKDEISSLLNTYSTALLGLLSDLLEQKHITNNLVEDNYSNWVAFEGIRKKMGIDEWLLKLEYLKFHDVKKNQDILVKDFFPQLSEKIKRIKHLNENLDNFLIESTSNQKT